MSTTPGTPHGSSHLLDQAWYWPDADRNIVSRVLSEQPDGSFILRNASTPGDYTLSVKYNGKVKLLKIVVNVNDGKCGFNLDALTHDSVVALVEFHRNISLNTFNDLLDVRLLYPVAARRNSQSGKYLKKGNIQHRMLLSAKTDQEWRERLELENLRAVHLAFERGAKLYDLAHQERERAESLSHALNLSVRDNEKKLSKLKDLLNVEAGVVTEVDGSRSTSTLLKQVFVNNQRFLEESIKRIETELTSSREKKTILDRILEGIRTRQADAKARLSRLMDLRTVVYDQMDASLASRTAAMLDSGTELINNEPSRVTDLLVDLPLHWTPAQFLMCGSSKENAANALVHARYRVAQRDKSNRDDAIDGVFLVRGSSSHPDKLVLSVLHGERVSHCLIGHNEEGWGFDKSDVYLTTISDFIRYYTKHCLSTHAEAIKTKLIMPAFDPVNKNSTAPLRNGPGQVFTTLPVSVKYMAAAMATDDPLAPLTNMSPELQEEMKKFASPEKLEKPDSLHLRSTTLPETIPE